MNNIDDLFKEELGVYTEAPPPMVWDALEKRLVALLKKQKPRGLLADLGFTLNIDAVKSSTVAFSFSFGVKDYQNAVKIKEIVNREILSFARKK